MSPNDFDDLAALWTEDKGGEVAAAVERLAPRAAARARLVQRGELAATCLLLVAILTALLLRPGPAVLITGSIVVVALLWSSWRRHQLGNMALLVDRSDEKSFIESTVRAKRAELRRSAVGVVTILPGAMLTLILVDAAQSGTFLTNPSSLTRLLSTPNGWFGLTVLSTGVWMAVRSHLRLKREFRELKQIRAAYLHEQEAEGL